MKKYTKNVAVYMPKVFVNEMDAYCTYAGFTRGKLLRRLLTDAWKEEKEANDERYQKALTYERENNSDSNEINGEEQNISRQTEDL